MSYVLTYISEGEHLKQDFKMRIDDAQKIARSLVFLKLTLKNLQ